MQTAMNDSDLTELRAALDQLDAQLITLLAQRFELTGRVGTYKKQNNLPAVDSAREAEQFARVDALAHEAGLDSAFAAKLLRVIIDEVVKNHQQARAND